MAGAAGVWCAGAKKKGVIRLGGAVGRVEQWQRCFRVALATGVRGRRGLFDVVVVIRVECDGERELVAVVGYEHGTAGIREGGEADATAVWWG